MFRLNKLKLISHPVLGDLNLDFQSRDFDRDNLYATVIIGQNGTGKSNILKVISEIFRTIALIKEGQEDAPIIWYKFYIKYTIDNVVYELKTLPKQGNDILCNKESIESDIFIESDTFIHTLADMVLPTRLLASSLMLTDKFNAKSTALYKYLGIRNENSPSSSGTRTYIRRTVDNIIDCLKRKNFTSELSNFFEALELEPSLELIYKPRYRQIFYTSDISKNTLDDAFGGNNWKLYFPRRQDPIWGTSRYNSIKDNDELINKIISFLQKNTGETIFRYNLITSSRSDLLEDFEIIKELSRLDIISFPELVISKRTGSYNFIESSSGETHLISEFIGLLSQIEDNSLILIDEPEISLHPNWQIKYIDFLKKTFRDYASCHFVIATHSHFILSNITSENSNVIALKCDKDNNIIDASTDIDTYGWSPENILYSVFNVTTTRNYYFENDVKELLYLIAHKNENKSKLNQIIERLDRVILSENDPLLNVINEAKTYIDEI